MGLFNFLKKNDKSEDTEKKTTKKNNTEIKLEDYIIEKIKSGMTVENAVKVFVLLESKKNNISLGYKNNKTYIYFRNPEISGFLNDWYGILQLYQHEKLSSNAYQKFIEMQLLENKYNEFEKPQENREKNENKKSEQKESSDYDDFYDIFKNNENDEEEKS